VFYGAMHAAPRLASRAATWFANAERGGAPGHAQKAYRAAYRHDSTSFRAVIASSFFVLLLAMALLVGGHAAIDPILRSAAAARDARSTADLVFAMPDGKFCRHMSFDNATAGIVEGTVRPCEEDIAKGQPRTTARGFAWGER
jgi:hypothetical protein